MAYTKIHPIKSTLKKALDYIMNPEKTDNRLLVSSFGCTPETADIEFRFTLDQAMNKGDNLAHHLIQSFKPGEVDFELAHQIGKQLADEVTGGKYEYVLTTHIDKGHIHNHIIFCAADFVEHHKYNSNKKTMYGIRRISDRICEENGLSVIRKTKGRGKSYAEYQADKAGTSWKGKLRLAVDALLPQVSSFEELLARLQAAGYEVKQEGFTACRAPGQKYFTSLKKLGPDYTEEALKERIEKKHTRPARGPRQERKEMSLLIDLENCLKAQENWGYEQWAKVFNLKQAAKTMSFLAKNQITRYEDLESKIAEVVTASEQASDSLKELESRLAKMGLMMKHLATYHQTKPVYEKYKKAKFKTAFRASNEASLILYEAAVKNLKAMQLDGKKLPTLSALQEDYARLDAEKEKLYEEYGKLKKQVKQLDTAKQNVDSILRQRGPADRKRENELE